MYYYSNYNTEYKKLDFNLLSDDCPLKTNITKCSLYTIENIKKKK